MTVTTRLRVEPTVPLAALLAAALVLVALPLAGVARAQDAEDEIQGDVVRSPADADAGEDGRIAAVRYAGEQRFATAALIATDTWPSSERAIIARHDDWPDALSGGYLAGVFESPVLLVSQNNLQDDTLVALEQLGVSQVTLLGGTQAISADNETALEDLGYEVDRIGGATRFETSAMVAAEGGAVGEIGGMRTAIVATGLQFADALTMGPLAYAGQFPILLTPSPSLHDATADTLVDLDIDQVLLAGGTGAISDEVADDIRDAIEGDEDSVQRLSGETRIETAAEVATFALGTDELGFTPFEHGWARGNEFADALTIGPRLGELRSPLLLVPTPTRLDSGEGTNADLAAQVACMTMRIDIAGGTAAVSETVEHGLREALACPDEPQLELTTDVRTAERGEAIEVTASVTDNVGTAFEGVEVDLAAESDTAVPMFDDDPVTTAADGTATTNVTSQTPGEAVLSGSASVDGADLSDDHRVEWTLPGETSAFTLELSSANEVGPDTGVDEDPPVTGMAWLFLNSDDGEICWAIHIDEPAEGQDIGSFEAFGAVNAHIHVGEAGTAGPVVVPLGQVDDTTLSDIDCDDAVDAGDLADVEADPAGYYVNVHTDTYPGGVVRGQLEVDAEA